MVIAAVHAWAPDAGRQRLQSPSPLRRREPTVSWGFEGLCHAPAVEAFKSAFTFCMSQGLLCPWALAWPGHRSVLRILAWSANPPVLMAAARVFCSAALRNA